MLLFLLKAAVLPLNLCVWVLLLNSAERLRSYYCEKIYVSLLVIRPLSTFHNGGKELEILCNNKQKKAFNGALCICNVQRAFEECNKLTHTHYGGCCKSRERFWCSSEIKVPVEDTFNGALNHPLSWRPFFWLPSKHNLT